MTAAGTCAKAEVGAVLPMALRPRLDTLRAVRTLLDDPAGRAWFGRGEARDERVGAPDWDRVVVRELAHTLSWLVRRLRPPADPPHAPPAWDARGRVFALLPRHGHLVHAIRRALPFALCGVRTVVAGHPHQADVVRQVVNGLGAAVGLPAADLTAPGAPATELVAGAGSGDLVVVTGSAGTATTVRRSTAATVLAACGRCTVGIGTRRSRLDRLAAALGRHRWPGSCTNWHGYFVGDWRSGSWTGPDGVDVDLPAALSLLRPTVVYAPVADLDAPGDLPHRLHGYAVLPCDPDGVVADLVGFGRDPSGGWPGDFTV